MVLLAVFFKFFSASNYSILSYICFAIISLIISLLLVGFLLETYIFRKIKLIYKIITKSKNSLKDAPNLKSTETTFEDVNIVVGEWADKKEKEISSLKTMSEYRRNYVGDISHELKTPLFSIEGYLHTLLEGGLSDPNINSKYLKRAMVNVERLQSIVDDLELINGFEAQSNQLKLTTFDLKALVEEVFSDLEHMAGKRNIAFQFKPGADKSYSVKADRSNIQTILVNLINNSIKYGVENGLTKVSFYDMEDLVLIEISDNGVGISEEDIKHVFDRFYRVDKSRSNQIPGTGLGLAIVKHSIEAHKQKLTIRSTLGKGSTLGFTLEKA